jgi:hypothetical protein
MSADRETQRIVRSWLRRDEHESADRVLNTVLALLDATPQRRSRWPARRIADMNLYAKLAIVAAAVLVVAVVGINLLPAGGGVGGVPAATPTPVPSHAQTPTSSPSPTLAADFPPIGELAVGRHSMVREGIPFSMSVLAPGWVSQQGFEFVNGPVGALDGASFIFWEFTPDNVHDDPCAHTPLAPAAGPGIANLASAVAGIPGTQLVSGPSDVTVGGHPAKRTVITIPEDVDCSAASFKLWYDDAMGPGGSRWPTVLPSTMSVWIIDVDGTLVWIDGETYRDTSPALEREMQQMIDSIEFD